MSTYKYIYWRPDMKKNDAGEMLANVHLLVGYNQGTLTDFQEMADKLRETFPQATNQQIRGGRVTGSTDADNFTIITWDAHIPRKKYPDWIQVDHGRPEYSW